MHRQRSVSGIAVSVLAAGTLFAAEAVHWGYEGEIGPEHWAGLSPEYAMCGSGVNQSPIDITRTFESDLDPVTVDHQAHANSVLNNGHTLQVNVDPGSWMRVGDESFQLVQFHFHSPSEHKINGELFPLEAHLVHADANGGLAVIGALYRTGEWNEDLARIGRIAPRATNETVPLDLDLSDLELYDDHEAYYRYNGSLTTPPCTEGVRWFVLKDIGHVAEEQVDRFVELIGEDARGPQPLNARIVLEK